MLAKAKAQAQKAVEDAKAQTQKTMEDAKAQAQKAVEDAKAQTQKAVQDTKAHLPSAQAVEAAAPPRATATSPTVTAPIPRVPGASTVHKMATTAAKLAAKNELPPLAESLAKGLTIYSQSFGSDLWLYLKNNHLILSLFLAHPQHPFSPMERRVCLVCSLCLGFGLTCLFNLVPNGSEKTILSVLVGGIVQGLYDFLLKSFANCLCVQRCPRVIVWLVEALGYLGLCAQFAFGLMFFGGGLGLLVSAAGTDALGGATWRFGASKAQAWLLTSVLVGTVSFWLARRKQMKPTTAEAQAQWNKRPESSCFGCLPAMPGAKAPSFLWTKFIGPEVEFSSLPSAAPTYEIKLCGMACGAADGDGRRVHPNAAGKSKHVEV